MKKLLFTAVAVLAFSSAGFAEGKEVKVKDFKTPCGRAGDAAYLNAIACGATREQALTEVFNVIYACNHPY
jgi:hypothetical protein